jgi:hypothetical protein
MKEATACSQRCNQASSGAQREAIP